MEQDTVVMQDIYTYERDGIDENGRCYGRLVATASADIHAARWRRASACRQAHSVSA